MKEKFEIDNEGLNKHREQTVEEILELLKYHDKVACERYTGYGKSHFIITSLIEKLNCEILIIVPNSNLINQYKSVYNNSPHIKILSYQILRNINGARLEELKDCKYIIADECHHILAPKWNEQLERIRNYLNAKIIGFTATPVRGDGRDVIDLYFNKVQVTPMNLFEGIANKFAYPIKYVVAFADIDAKYDKKLKEVDRYQIQNLLNIPGTIKKHISKEQLKHNLKVCLFVSRIADIEEAKESAYKWFHEAYPDKKIICYTISSKNDSYYIDSTLDEFRKSNEDNRIDIVVSVDMLKEGLHLPAMGVEIMLRKTISPTTYFQQIGRVVNSQESVIFDLVNNEDHIKAIEKESVYYSKKLSKGFEFKNDSQKLKFENCINLIFETKEISNIYTKYKRFQRNSDEVDKIIDNNLDFIRENCRNYSINKIARQLDLDPVTFEKHINDLKYKEYNIEFNKTTKSSYDEVDKIIDNNLDFIRENCSKYTINQMALYLHLSFSTFEKHINDPKYAEYSIKFKKTRRTYDEVDKIIDNNLDFIRENFNKIGGYKVAKLINIDPIRLFDHLKKEKYNSLKLDFDRKINLTQEQVDQIILKNKKYIEQNPDKISSIKEMARQLRIK